MRRLLFCLAALFPCSWLAAQDQIHWKNSVAPDGSFSMQQPEGWAVQYGPSNAHLANPARNEEIIVIRLPRDPAKSAGVYAGAVASSFRQSLPSFQMSNLNASGDTAAFLVTYSSAGANYAGPGVVTIKQTAAWWVSYGSQSAADLTRGAALIAGLAKSLADGTAPVSVAVPSPASFSLPGNWGTVGNLGDLVNPSTGAFLQSVYTGEWYTFNADGTYRYAIAGSGQFITGIVICNGKYDVSGSTVRLHQKTESWFPMPRDATRKPMYKDRSMPDEITLTIEPKGPTEMLIRRGTSTGTFHRDPNSK